MKKPAHELPQMLILLSLTFSQGKLRPTYQFLLSVGTFDRSAYFPIKTCIKCHKALAPLTLPCVVAVGSWLGKVPSTVVSFCTTSLVSFNGVTFPVSKSSVPFTSLSYEKPVWTGWSIYRMLTSLFQLQGFRVVLLESALMVQGPPSPFTPSREVSPAPPAR